ncbi:MULTISPECIES: ATP-binding protein [unclassified Burkholderia]|uniref:ATP-binding protein n=1 Tax=unclassified Burkholderia TaxID=2613784 RepID=UPI00149550DC|nr:MULTISPECIES: ATP-binding protein [unclassified Burkholderia]
MKGAPQIRDIAAHLDAPERATSEYHHLYNLLVVLAPMDDLLRRRLNDTLSESPLDWTDVSSTSPDALLMQIHQRLGTEQWAQDLAEMGDARCLPDVLPDNRFGNLSERLGLSAFERRLLLLGLLPQIDVRYGGLYAFLQQNQSRTALTVDLALSLLCDDMVEQVECQAYLTPHATLFRYGILRLQRRERRRSVRDDGELQLDSAILHFLLGHDYLPTILATSARWLAPPAWEPDEAERDLVRRLSTCIGTDQEATQCIVLRSQLHSGRAGTVARAAAEVDAGALELDLGTLPSDDDDAEDVLIGALREAGMRGAWLVLRGLDDMASERKHLFARWRAHLRAHRWPVVCLIAAHASAIWLGDLPQLVLDVPRRSLAEHEAAMRGALRDTQLAGPFDVPTLVKRYPVPVDQYESAVQEANGYCRQRGPGARISDADLRRALSLRTQQNFGKLAQRIHPTRDFDDLIVGDDLQRHLHEILAAIRHRDWALQQGFQRKIGETCGISALFFGDSGTGKTMAAEVLAGELGVDLIKIDLSTVVNKYIGETEKNLARVFDLAEADCGVLFFDEADALFGKRTETKDAQDRHANIEVSYLLQRLEQYPGLVILSTNNRTHLDSAFNRRLTFIARFPFPDAAQRARMWRAIWPPALKVSSDIDFSSLAKKYEITGANIRNIALLATWLSAEDGAPHVAMIHVEQAIRRELSKIGRIIT